MALVAEIFAGRPDLVGDENLGWLRGALTSHSQICARTTGLRYRLAVEKAAPYARYHAVAEEGVPFRQIATSIGAGLDLPVQSIEPETAASHYGWFSHFAAMDIQASSVQTRASLAWAPNGESLLEDLAGPAYFGAG
nr:hypothetical protein [Neorhizobium sp. R1-B]